MELAAADLLYMPGLGLQMVALLEDLISGEAHCYLRDIVCLFGMSGAMSHWLGVCGTNVRVFLQVLMYVRGVVCLVHGWWRSPDLFTCRSCWSASDPVLYDPSPTVPQAHILYSMPGLDWNLYSVHH